MVLAFLVLFDNGGTFTLNFCHKDYIAARRERLVFWSSGEEKKCQEMIYAEIEVIPRERDRRAERWVRNSPMLDLQ